MSNLTDAKTALRITSTAYDAEVENLIAAAIADLIAGGVCHDAQFMQWIAENYGQDCQDSEAAAAFLRSICGIESRALLDSNPQAAEVFRGILGHFDEWKRAQG